jgi:hypothetical protein
LEIGQFIIRNVRDSHVITLNGNGEAALALRDASDPTQLWRFGMLCSGGAVLSNVGTGQQLGPGPWTFDSATNLLQAGNGQWARSLKRGHTFKLMQTVMWGKDNGSGRMPWKWFQWSLITV